MSRRSGSARGAGGNPSPYRDPTSTGLGSLKQKIDEAGEQFLTGERFEK
jgi:hypothetical protein